MENFTTTVQDDLCLVRTLHARVVTVLCCVCAMILGHSILPAQALTTRDVKELGFSVSVPNVILMAGQTVEATINVGSNVARIGHARGFELWVELSDYGVLMPSLSPDGQGSWFLNPALPVAESHDPTLANRYTFRADRVTSVDGGGMVLKIQLKASKDNVSAASIVQRAGGIMHIDNLELRMAATTPPALEIWPNPADQGARSVQVRCAGMPAQAITMTSLDGQVLGHFDPAQPLDLSAFAAGSYLMKVTDAQGRVMHRHVLLR